MLTSLLEALSSWIVGGVFSISKNTLLYKALTFFIADVIKIFILLFTIIYIVAVIRSFFPPEKTKKLLSHKRTVFGNIAAALIGVVTPF